jgi:hypothetical protein
MLFHSSLCDMFHTATSRDRRKQQQQQQQHTKTDACALAFCGIWLWERNRFLLTGETPKRWVDRPLETSMVVLLITTAVVWSLDPHNVFVSISLLLVGCCFLWKIFEFQYTRSVFRQQLAIEEFHRRRRRRRKQQQQRKLDDLDTTQQQQQQQQDNTMEGTATAGALEHSIYYSTSDSRVRPQDDPELLQFLSDHQREVYGDGSHAFCGCANARLGPLESYNDDDDEEDDDNNNGENNAREDFCFRLWALISNLCCGWLCHCYCQLCGMCAIAQEHRYLSEVLPDDPSLCQRDYITLQPWKEYVPAILRLRISGQMQFFQHLKAMSILSNRLALAAAIFLVVVTLVITLLPVQFPRWQILVVRKI